MNFVTKNMALPDKRRARSVSSLFVKQVLNLDPDVCVVVELEKDIPAARQQSRLSSRLRGIGLKYGQNFAVRLIDEGLGVWRLPKEP